MYKISIIIPVYNGEKYLKKALDSIRTQTFNFNDVEIIIVSDGSTDKTNEIANEFIKKYNNCKFFKFDKPSGAPGKPRNLGIKMATGKYLMFLDSDDFYENDALTNMYNAIENTNYYFINTNYTLVNDNGENLNKNGFDNKLCSKELTLEDLNNNVIYCNGAVWNKIFNMNFIKKNNIQFLENGEYAEDLYFVISCLLKCEKALFLPNIISVNYRVVDTSVSRNISYNYFKKINQGYLQIYNKFKEYNKENYCKYLLAEAKLFFIKNLICSNKINNEQFIDIINEMKWYFIFLNNYNFFDQNNLGEKFTNALLNDNYKLLIKMKETKNFNNI